LFSGGATGIRPNYNIGDTVSDGMGAVVMNAKVSVTITATGDTRKQLSGSDGRFVFTPRITGAHIP
jgi:hypothetical protein